MMFPSPAPEHPAKPLKCLAFRGLCFLGGGKVSKHLSDFRLGVTVSAVSFGVSLSYAWCDDDNDLG